jgi:small basic protein (TIGR04137 family)
VSLDKSLKRKDMLLRRRNVLTRAERIERLVEDERFNAGTDSVFGLPKVKPAMVIVAPSKGPAKEEAAEGEAAEGAAPKDED